MQEPRFDIIESVKNIRFKWFLWKMEVYIMKKLFHITTLIVLMAALARPTHTSERSPRVTSDNLQKAQSLVQYLHLVPNLNNPITPIAKAYRMILEDAAALEAEHDEDPLKKEENDEKIVMLANAFASHMQQWSSSELAKAFCTIRRIELNQFVNGKNPFIVLEPDSVFGYKVETPPLLSRAMKKDFALSEEIFNMIDKRSKSKAQNNDALKAINACINVISTPSATDGESEDKTPEKKLNLYLLSLINFFNHPQNSDFSAGQFTQLQKLHLVNTAYFLEKNVPQMFQKASQWIHFIRAQKMLDYIQTIAPEVLPKIVLAIQANENLTGKDVISTIKEKAQLLIDKANANYAAYKKALPAVVKEGLPQTDIKCDIQEVPKELQKIMIEYTEEQP